MKKTAVIFSDILVTFFHLCQSGNNLFKKKNVYLGHCSKQKSKCYIYLRHKDFYKAKHEVKNIAHKKILRCSTTIVVLFAPYAFGLVSEPFRILSQFRTFWYLLWICSVAERLIASLSLTSYYIDSLRNVNKNISILELIAFTHLFLLFVVLAFVEAQ